MWLERILVVVKSALAGAGVVEVARGANRLLAGVGDLKPGGLVPVVVADGVRVFGVRLVIFAGEDLRLLLEPASPQSLDRRAILHGLECTAELQVLMFAGGRLIAW